MPPDIGAKKEKIVKVVYIGVRLNMKNEPISYWKILNHDGTLTEHKSDIGFHHVKRGKEQNKLNGGSFVGSICSFETEDDDTYRFLEFNERWENEKELNEWKLGQREAEIQMEMKAQSEKISLGSLTLDELQDRYHKIIGRSRRAALLALITQHITN